MLSAAKASQGIEFEKQKYNPRTGIYTVPAEMITRWYNSTLDGQNFNISYL